MLKSLLLATMALLTGISATNPWEARHDLTSDQYQSTFNNLTAQGYRLNHVSGYSLANIPRFAALFEKKPSPSWVARHGLTSAAYQAAFDAYLSQGYRLVHVDGYTVGGVDYYAAIWDKSSSGAWVARHGLTSAEYQAAFDGYVSQGYRLRHVSGYAVGSEARYAGIWERVNDGVAWVARHGLTGAAYQAAFDAYVSQGHRLVGVSGYTVNGLDYYAALWDKSPSAAWVARHGLTSSGYQAAFDLYKGQGYVPKVVSGYNSGHFAAIWDKA